MSLERYIELIKYFSSGADLKKKIQNHCDFSEVSDEELNELERIIKVIEQVDEFEQLERKRNWDLATEEDNIQCRSISKKVKMTIRVK